MKKITIILFVVIFVVLLPMAIATIVTTNFPHLDREMERSITAELMYVSDPMTSTSGMPCLTLTFMKRIEFTAQSSWSESHNRHYYKTDTCIVYPIDLIPKDLYNGYLNKDVEMTYQIRDLTRTPWLYLKSFRIIS